MPFKKHDRQYDLVIFGATGYTGQMTAEHVASHLPTDLKWAIAGRSAEKLKKVADECKSLNPDRTQPAIEICNLNDVELSSLAKKTFVLITTVGPYAKYGEHAFKACAENGTHYLDVTGEAAWTRAMLKKYEQAAKSSGALMFPQSGIESAPSDLINWALASRIRSEFGAQTGDVTVSVYDLHSAPSGGTLATAIGLVEAFPLKEIAASHRPYNMSPVENPYRGPKPSIVTKLTGVRSIANLGLQATSITAGTNAAIVERTWGLFKELPSRQKQFFGPNFSYREYMKPRNWLSGIAMHYGLALFGILLLLAPFRALLRRLVFQPGEGPSREDAAKDSIEFRGVANPDVKPPTGKQVLCRAWYSGSMYYMTALLLGQAAYTILQDELDLEGGVLTPACLGQGFIDRVNDAGFKFELKTVDV